MMTEIKFPTGQGRKREQQLWEFGVAIKKITRKVGLKLSVRGWCYILEGMGMITKKQFGKAGKLINECRKKGILPWDFVLLDKTRSFDCLEGLDPSKKEYLKKWIGYLQGIHKYYDGVSFWENQEYYVQMLVEKIDLVSLFKPLCAKYHIPIANTKGWSDIGQRVRMIERFKEAEDNGKKCILLYCGDFDPAGVQISDKLRKNLNDLKEITQWASDKYEESGPEYGYDLAIDRFGLNYDFIKKAGLTWIDNLETGSGKNLASPTHPSYHALKIPEWIEAYGARKVEANALVIQPKMGRELCENAIRKYVDLSRGIEWQDNKKRARSNVKRMMTKFGITKALEQARKNMMGVEK